MNSSRPVARQRERMRITHDRHELWRLLNEIRGTSIGRGLGSKVSSKFIESLAELRDELAMYFVAEEAEDRLRTKFIFSGIWAAEADALRREHEPLYLEIALLADEAGEWRYTSPDTGAVRDLLERLSRFDTRLILHESRERALYRQAIGAT